jgi:hypothetical protein
MVNFVEVVSVAVVLSVWVLVHCSLEKMDPDLLRGPIVPRRVWSTLSFVSFVQVAVVNPARRLHDDREGR